MAERGQLAMFMDIYAKRVEAGTWKSDISGKPLYHQGHPQFHWQFAHVIPKSVAPAYKLNPDNIVCLMPAEHQFFEHFNEGYKRKALFKLYEREWNGLFERKQALKEKYFAERNTLKP